MLLIPKLTSGGAEKTICNLSILLEKYNEVILVVFSDENITYQYAGKLLKLDSLKTEKDNIFFKVIKNLIRLYKIKEIKRKYSIDTSISFLDTPNLLNVLTKKNERVIISIRNLQSTIDENRIKKIITKFILNKADKIVAISKLVKNDLEDNYKTNPEKINVIYNMCPIEDIKEKMKESLSSKEETIYDKGINLVTCGRLVEQKGQWHLIRVMYHLVKEVSILKLIILGQGELEKKLKKMVKEYKLEKNIVFLGYKKNPYKYLAKADIFVFSSLYEGLGNTLLEVLACDIPIISSNCVAGPCEILDDSIVIDEKNIIYGKYGILVPAFKNDNFDTISELNNEERKLLKLLTDILNRKIKLDEYKKRGKERVKNFSGEIIEKEWIKIIENF